MSDLDDQDGPVVLDTWVTSREAVQALDAFCVERKWVFTETPGQSDFGKDGYIDLSREGKLTGQCIAVQVKGGSSSRRSNGYAIRADRRRRRFWRDSTVPVFGIIWDPDIGSLFWVDLTAALLGSDLTGALEVPATNRLDDADLDAFLGAVWQSTTHSSVSSALGSDDTELQELAVYDCWAMGRRDPRYLVLLRRVMFGLSLASFDLAIYVLNSCALNPDNLLDKRWMTMEDRRSVREHFRWTVDEAVTLLGRAQDEDGCTRGSFSSCIYWLIVGSDPAGDHFVPLVAQATTRAATEGYEQAAKWGLVLCVYWAGTSGSDVLETLLDQAPALRGSEMATHLASDLATYGYVDIT
jgi:hypothetical protein